MMDFLFGQKLILEMLEVQDLYLATSLCLNFNEYQSNLDPAIIILQVDHCFTFCSRNRGKHIT